MINYFISILGKFPLDCILQIVCILKVTSVTSLVVQRPRLCTPDAGAQVLSLVRKLDPTCCN